MQQLREESVGGRTETASAVWVLKADKPRLNQLVLGLKLSGIEEANQTYAISALLDFVFGQEETPIGDAIRAISA